MARCRDGLLLLKYLVAHAAVASCCLSGSRARRLGTRQLFSDMIAEQNVIRSLRNNVISHAAVDLNRLPYTFSLCQAAILRKFQMQERLTLFFANTCRKSILAFIRLFWQGIDRLIRHFFSIPVADTPFYCGKRDIYCLISRRQYYRTDIDRFHGIEFTTYKNIDSVIANFLFRICIRNSDSKPGLTTVLCINDTIFYLNDVFIIITELYIVLVFLHFALVKLSIFVCSTVVYIHLHSHPLTRKEIRTCVGRTVDDPVANCYVFSTNMCSAINWINKFSIFIRNDKFQLNIPRILSSLHFKAVSVFQCFYADNISRCIFFIRKLNSIELHRVQLPTRTVLVIFIDLQPDNSI